MVSPPSLPGLPYSSKFPLFNRLLHESLSGRIPARNGNYPECPATAPVLSTSAKTRTVEMEKDVGDKDKNLNIETVALEEHPIKLLDPPKSKLKRQLSKDTFDQSDELRVRKKLALLSQAERGQDIPSRKDEVDGGGTSCAANIVHLDTPRSFTTDVYETRVSTYPNSSVREKAHKLTETVYDASDVQKPYTTDYVPLPSPNRFNLSDIGLTSPFASRTNTGEKFVYPETISPRKVSPYKAMHDEYLERDYHEKIDGYTMLDRFTHEATYRKETFQNSEPIKKDIANHDEEKASYATCHLNQQSHVSERGFSWPEKATVTEPVPFSPRIVSTETRPRFPSNLANSERLKKTQEENELKARLRVLEREYARASEVYGTPHDLKDFRQMSPTSRSVENLRRGTLRSFSNNDRSPNEKDIREITEEVRSRYDRSLSDPRCSPRQMYDAIMRPSPLCRQYEEPSRNSLSQERYSERWREDAKRRLFVKSDSTYINDYKRQSSSQYNRPTMHQSTEIPREVLSLLHAQNFHPEALENLKDAFRRSTSKHGGTEEDEGIFKRIPQDHFDNAREPYGRYMPDRVTNRRDISFEEWNPPRQRLPGEIDVRLTCESLKENTKKTEEILQELEHDNKDCKCAKIEHEIRLMAMDAYSKIRRTDRSAEAHDQFQNELNETNANVYMSMRVLCGIKCLCKYGRTIEEVFSGSVVFRIKCTNIDALLDLWHSYKNGDLLKEMKDAFINEELLERYGCESVELNVKIDWKNYIDCKQDLDTSLTSSFIETPTKSPLTPVHGRTRSEPASVTKQANQVLQPKTAHSPFRERFCSDSSVELSPRRAFQELNAGKHPVHPPSSPSKKLSRDNVFFDESSRSPLTSPRGKTTFVFKPQNERENVDAGDPFIV